MHPWVTLPEGVMYQDVYIGKGKSIEKGVAVHTHLRGFFEDGTEFDNTFSKKQWFIFTYGRTPVLKGYELGIASMKEGGKRIIVIPSELAYGNDGFEDDETSIAPDSVLIFDVSLLWIRAPETEKLDLFR